MRNVTVFQFLSNPGEANNCQCPAKSASNTKDNTFNESIIPLLHEQRTTENRAVHCDQRQEDAKRVVKRREKLIESHFKDLNHRRDNTDETN